MSPSFNLDKKFHGGLLEFHGLYSRLRLLQFLDCIGELTGKPLENCQKDAKKLSKTVEKLCQVQVAENNGIPASWSSSSNVADNAVKLTDSRSHY